MLLSNFIAAASRRHFAALASVDLAAPRALARSSVMFVDDSQYVTRATPAFRLAAQLAKQRADARTTPAAETIADIAIGHNVA
ncbi:MAG: hypothetical protein WB816_13085 [Methylocystis sp.]